MSTRNDVLADEIATLRERVRELEAQLVSQPYTLASGEPVAWDLYNETGRYDLTDSLAMAREWEKTAGNVAYPLYRHPARPSAAGVTVTEAMVERFSLAYRICEETHERTFTHNMGIKAGLTAALTAASEGASA